MTGFGVRALSVRFGHVHALHEVDLDASAGAVTAVVGGDGAGKSTLLRVLAHRVAPETGGVWTVDREHLGYQPATSGVWPTLTVQENVELVGGSYRMRPSTIRERSDELLSRAGLDTARDRLGRELSGGMRQKLGFVLAVLHAPELVLLDEPSTGVDPVSRVELWRLVAAVATGGAAVVMATTYLDEAQRAASVLVLDSGRVLASGSPEDVVASVPGSIGVLRDDGDVPADQAPRVWRRGRERHLWSPEALPPHTEPIARPDFEDALVALTLASRHEAVPDPALASPGEASERAAATLVPVRTAGLGGGGPVAVAAGVTKRFGRHTALDDVSLEVRPGEIVGLIGANGAGKTTLLRILLGLERADEGDVQVFGSAPDRATLRRVGYVPQGLGLYTTLTVQENAAFASRVYGTPAVVLPPALAEISSERVAAIGLGRQRQLAFALALSHRPDLLVLDEPTSGVDPLARARLWDVIHDAAAAGRAIVVTTHYLQEAEQCDRLVLLAHAHQIGTGTVAELTGGDRAVLVRTADWQRAFEALDRADMPLMLTGRDIRIAGVTTAAVNEALGDISAEIQEVAPTLEETMVLLDRAQGTLQGAAR